MTQPVHARAAILMRRTYNRPLDDAGTKFETFPETIDRVISHQRYLWEHAQGDDLTAPQHEELGSLRRIMMDREASVSGRTLWLGGTELVKRRPASAFNCAYEDVRTVHDIVDAYWLLLQGSGVGFRPISGTLSGFTRKMAVEVIRSTRTERGGRETNTETFDQKTGVWTISVGDSAEAWAKSIGKILAGKYPAKKLVLDFSEIRPAGSRLKGYGWICSGDAGVAQAYQAIAKLMNERAGLLLTKNDIIDVVNWLGTVLSSRRSAQIALMDYGDPEWRAFASRKPPGFDKGPNWFRGQSNNSLVFYSKPSRKQLKDILELMIANGGSEPGFINMEQALLRAPWARGFNPCSVGETLVATADGRGSVPIAELAMTGRDVLVYCIDGSGDLAIRTMRNPRKTGKSLPVFKVTLDDGSTIRVTGNHRFRLRNGANVEVTDLKKGDSLALMTRYVPDGTDPASPSYADRYKFIQFRADSFPEHRFLGAHKYGRPLLAEEHIHHVDEDKMNNLLDNLELKHEGSHLSEHNAAEENPRYSGITGEQLLEHGKALAIREGGRFSGSTWAAYAQENDLPQSFSSWRRLALGDLATFARRCALEANLDPDVVDLDPRTVRVYRDMLAQVYDCEIVDRRVVVRRQCTHCQKDIVVPHGQREVSYCSMTCSNLGRGDAWKEKGLVNMKAAHDSNRAKKREQQLDVFTALKSDLGRTPQKAEWKAACKAADISPEMNRPSSPFPSWRALQDAAPVFNHRVESVEPDGLEDVYNGTVDDFHNFFVGGWESQTGYGRTRHQYINNTNCGEIILADKGFCNLVEFDVAKFRGDIPRLHSVTNLIARANYRQTVVNLRDGILQDSWHQQNEYLRLCGVGATGIARRPDMTPWEYRQLRVNANHAAYSMADELGLERPKNVTTIKPSGTLSKAFFDTTEGGHKPKARHIFNHVQFSEHDPLVPMLQAAGYRVYPHPTACDSVLAVLPVSYADVPLDQHNGHEVDRESAVTQLQRYRMLNRSWSDQNTSITVSYDPSEEKSIVDWFMNNWDDYVATSFLFRADPTKTAEDLGFAYLPQECVTGAQYEAYNSTLKPIDVDSVEERGIFEIDAGSECAGGACPVR